ncbi:MAG TPA: lysylphosphatidylglycerol synthase domain-containing protein [Gaiellaceae bacterium]|jgi:uncharacterized membrane protein YbhN (UPF0104 family)|nr:lysylphosphatidylglycerol synthase domain-containing protein [Gaiellaceae bacterium]
MNFAQLRLRSHLGPRTLAAAGIVCMALLAVAATPQLLGSDVRRAIVGLEHARPIWLWAAAAGLFAALLCNAWVWRSAILLVGGRIDRARAVACYGVGSLVNTATPARIGDAARIALFSRAFEAGSDRYWKTGGVFGAIGAARALVLGVLVLVASVLGALPRWPLLVLGGFVLAALVAAFLARSRRPHRHVAHVLDAFRTLWRSPLGGARIVGWVSAATAARVGGAAAIAAALGVSHPLLAAAIIVPALDLATLVPLTPGNVGVVSGAVAVTLQTRGVDLTKALTTGIALHAIETAVSIVVGAAGALYLARFASATGRRRALAIAGAACVVLLVGAFSATVFADFV